MKRSMADAQLCFAKEFITSVKDEHDKISPKKVQETFREQCANYRIEIQQKGNDIATSIAKKKFTGKTSGGRK